MVLLPDPDSPTSPSTSPGATVKDTPATACSGGPAWNSGPLGGEMPDEVDDVEQSGQCEVRARASARQRTRCRSPARSSAGRRAMQGSGTQCGQRGWNRPALRLLAEARHRGPRWPAAARPRGPCQGAGWSAAGRACRACACPSKIARVGAALHRLARIHHEDPVGDLGRDAEIVGDEDHPHRQLLLQLCG